MRDVLSALWSALATILNLVPKATTTLERGLNALDSYAKWAEDEAAAFEQEGALQRQKRLAELRLRLETEPPTLTKAA